MGRPDTLGADAYHNQRFPTVLGSSGESTSTSENRSVEPPYCGIIKSMVDFSRIIRSICLGVYLPEIERTLSKTVAVAKKIEEDLENWVDSLPESIRPTKNPAQLPRCLRNAKEPNWVKRQRLVLTIRRFPCVWRTSFRPFQFITLERSKENGNLTCCGALDRIFQRENSVVRLFPICFADDDSGDGVGRGTIVHA